MTTHSRLHTISQLFRSSWQVIKRNPKLLLFPFVNAAIYFLSPLVFVPWPLIAHQVTNAITTRDADQFIDLQNTWMQNMTLADYLYLVLFNVATTFLATFINVAFYNEIFYALDGGIASLRGGLQFAKQRLRPIVLWSLFASSVPTLPRIFKNCVKWDGSIVTFPIVLAWGVATVFVIPILIRGDNSEPMALFRDSARILKKALGELIIGFIKIQFTGIVIGVAIMFVVAAAMSPFLSPAQMFNDPLIGPDIMLCTMPVIWVQIVATNIYCCVLYIYASEGAVPEPFTPEMMDAAWKVKKA